MSQTPITDGPRSAHDLAQRYTRTQRIIEIVSIISFFILSGALVLRLHKLSANLGLWTGAFLVGLVAADFVSGFVHWFADTWGTVEWPIVGESLIRSFREHHVDQESITRHDFIETNGSNCLVSIPVLIMGLLLPIRAGSSIQIFLLCALLWLTLWIFMTNQIHKWSHQREPAPLIALLQRYHLILPRDHHSLHHSAPYTKHYCITTGWMNPILLKIQFFRRLEELIHKTTGAIPRQDDLGKRAAEELIKT